MQEWLYGLILNSVYFIIIFSASLEYNLCFYRFLLQLQCVDLSIL